MPNLEITGFPAVKDVQNVIPCPLIGIIHHKEPGELLRVDRQDKPGLLCLLLVRGALGQNQDSAIAQDCTHALEGTKHVGLIGRMKDGTR
jgi:hypothetical protein